MSVDAGDECLSFDKDGTIGLHQEMSFCMSLLGALKWSKSFLIFGRTKFIYKVLIHIFIRAVENNALIM